MSVTDLIKVKSPPAEPIDAGPIEAKSTIEHTLGISLPTDLYEFGLRYGSGRFGDTIRVYNPFSATYLEIINEVCSVYRELRMSEGDQFVPHDVFPNKPGLFPWGDDVNGHMMFWLTEDDPAQWPIVLMTVDGDSEQLELPMTTFLAKILNNEMSCVLWDEAWLKDNTAKMDFNPSID